MGKDPLAPDRKRRVSSERCLAMELTPGRRTGRKPRLLLQTRPPYPPFRDSSAQEHSRGTGLDAALCHRVGWRAMSRHSKCRLKWHAP